MTVRVFPVFATLLLSATAAQGQACLGLASLETRPMNVTASAEFVDGGNGGDGRFGFGTPKVFGGVTVKVAKTDGVSGTTKGAGVDGGMSYAVGATKRAMLCPVASVEYLKSPDFDDGEGGTIEASGTGATAGLAIGGVINSSSGIGFIPFASARAAYSRISVSSGNFSESSSDTYGILAGGLSLVFNPSLLIRPFVQVPVGLDGADPSYGVGVSLSFGKR